MRKYVIIAVLVAMILGLMSVTGAAAYGGDDNVGDRGGPFKSEEAVLVTVCENLELEWGESIPLKAINTKGYNNFKLYAYATPFEGVNPAHVRISLSELATPGGGIYMSRSPSTDEWIPWSMSAEPHYSMVIPISEGIYSVLRVGGWYSSGPPGSTPPLPDPYSPVTVSIYLLMAK